MPKSDENGRNSPKWKDILLLIGGAIAIAVAIDWTLLMRLKEDYSDVKEILDSRTDRTQARLATIDARLYELSREVKELRGELNVQTRGLP